jgi:hypothetical protein
VTRDMFDASEGVTASRTSDGQVGLMLKLTPQAARMVTAAVEAWQDHGCSVAIELGLYMLHVAGANLEDVVEEIPEVKDWNPFEHK